MCVRVCVCVRVCSKSFSFTDLCDLSSDLEGNSDFVELYMKSTLQRLIMLLLCKVMYVIFLTQ